MEKERYTSNQLFSIFFLREQLHSYLDVFEENHSEISQQIDYQNAMVLWNTKRFMVSLAEKQFLRFRHVAVKDASIFQTPVKLWLNASALKERRNGASIKGALITFDKKVMAWCYLCMVNEDTDMELSGFLLKMIECAKSDADYVLFKSNK